MSEIKANLMQGDTENAKTLAKLRMVITHSPRSHSLIHSLSQQYNYHPTSHWKGEGTEAQRGSAALLRSHSLGNCGTSTEASLLASQQRLSPRQDFCVSCYTTITTTPGK